MSKQEYIVKSNGVIQKFDSLNSALFVFNVLKTYEYNVILYNSIL